MEPDPLLKPVEVLKTASYGLEVLALLPQLLISRMPTPEPAHADEPIAEDADKDEDGEGASAPAPLELTLGTNLHFIFRGISRGIPVMLWWYNSALGRTSDEGMKLLVSRYAVSGHDNPAMLLGGCVRASTSSEQSLIMLPYSVSEAVDPELAEGSESACVPLVV